MKPLVVRRVAGHSMEPTLRDGQLVLASAILPVRDGDVVVVKTASSDEVIKRLRIAADGQRLLTGDNSSEHHDLAWQNDMVIVGRLFWPVI